MAAVPPSRPFVPKRLNLSEYIPESEGEWPGFFAETTSSISLETNLSVMFATSGVSFYAPAHDAQLDGSGSYQEVAAEEVIDFESDGNVLFLSVESTQTILAPKFVGLEARVRADPSAEAASRAELRAALCSGALHVHDYRLAPADFPLSTCTRRFPYRAIIFSVPIELWKMDGLGGVKERADGSDHFVIVVYYLDSPMDAAGKVNLYYYDSNGGDVDDERLRHIKLTRMMCHRLVHIMEVFAPKPRGYNLISVTGARALQRGRSCSSWTLNFGAQIKERIMSGDIGPYDKLAPGQLDSCSVAILKTLRDRIKTEASMFAKAVSFNPHVPFPWFRDFVERRITFNSSPEIRKAALANSLRRLFLPEWRDVPVDVTPVAESRRTNFAESIDQANEANIDPDVVRLFIINSMLVPSSVVVVTSYVQLVSAWIRNVTRFKAHLEALRKRTESWDPFGAGCASLIMWIYLPPVEPSGEPKEPALLVGRPYYHAAAKSFVAIPSLLCHTSETDERVLDELNSSFWRAVPPFKEEGSPDPILWTEFATDLIWMSWRYSVIDYAIRYAQAEGAGLERPLSDPGPEFDQYPSWGRPLPPSVPVMGSITDRIFRDSRKLTTADDFRLVKAHRRARYRFWGKVLSVASGSEDRYLLANTLGPRSVLNLDSVSCYTYAASEMPFTTEPPEPSHRSILALAWIRAYNNFSLRACVSVTSTALQTYSPSVPEAVLSELNAPRVFDSWQINAPPRRQSLKFPVVISGESAEFPLSMDLGVIEAVISHYRYSAVADVATSDINEFLKLRDELVAAGFVQGPTHLHQDPYLHFVIKGFSADYRRRLSIAIGRYTAAPPPSKADRERRIYLEPFGRIVTLAMVFIVRDAKQ
jgi:hypothetical protein